MKVNVKGVKSVFITGDFIKLDALLKYASVVSSGGEAKVRIQNGEVILSGEVCTARGKKVKPGDIVRCGENVFLIKQAT